MIDASKTKDSPIVSQALVEIRMAANAVVWPPGANRFTIYPKKLGNGVGPYLPVRDLSNSKALSGDPTIPMVVVFEARLPALFSTSPPYYKIAILLRTLWIDE